MEEFVRWPDAMMSRLLSGPVEKTAIRTARLGTIFEGGFVLHTDCTGRMTPEVACAMLCATLADLGVPSRTDWMLHWCGCDILEVSRKIMSNAGPLKPQHIFGCIIDRLPPKIAYAIQH